MVDTRKKEQRLKVKSMIESPEREALLDQQPEVTQPNCASRNVPN
jgi:hypothetical protein